MSFAEMTTGEILRRDGDSDAALAHYEEALTAAYQSVERFLIATTLVSSVRFVRRASSPVDRARVESEYIEAIGLYRDRGNEWAMAYSLLGLGGVRVIGGDATTATKLLAAGKAWLDRYGLVIEPLDHAAVESYVDAARRTLGPVAFEDAWRRGTSL